MKGGGVGGKLVLPSRREIHFVICKYFLSAYCMPGSVAGTGGGQPGPCSGNVAGRSEGAEGSQGFGTDSEAGV